MKYITLLIIIQVFSLHADDFDKLYLENLPYQVTTNIADDFNSVLTENEKYMYFISNRSGNYGIYLKDLELGTEVIITDDPNDETNVNLYDGDLYFYTNASDVNFRLVRTGLKGGDYNYIEPPILDMKKVSFYDYGVIFSDNGTFKFTDTDGDIKVFNGAKGEILKIFGDYCFYSSIKDKDGTNNLFLAKFEDYKILEPIQLTYGQNIIIDFDVSNDGRELVYETKNFDTNKNGKVDLDDNSILFLFKFTEDMNFQEPLKLTSFTKNSENPKVSKDFIYYTSKKQNTRDIFRISKKGIIPNFVTPNEYLNYADYLIKSYNISQDINYISVALQTYELLSVISINNNDILLKSYEGIARCYEILKYYGEAESVYRLMSYKFKDDEKVSAISEAKQKITELIKKGVNDLDSYEAVSVIEFLEDKAYGSANPEIIQGMNYLLGEFAYENGAYDKSFEYFEYVTNIETNNTEIIAKSYYRLGQIKEKSGEKHRAVFYYKSGYNTTNNPILKEQCLFNYFQLLTEDSDQLEKKIRNIISSSESDYDLKVYGEFLIAEKASDFDAKVEQYDIVKREYLKNKDNLFLKNLAAQSDIKIGKLYLENNYYSQAEAVLKRTAEEYSNINYGYYSREAKKILLNLVLKNANTSYENNKIENALLKYMEAYNYDKENIKAIRGVIKCYEKVGDIDKAITLFQEEVISNDIFSVNYGYGYALSLKHATKNNIDEEGINLSIEYLEKSIQQNFRQPYAYLTLSFNYEMLYLIDLKKSDEERQKNYLEQTVRYILEPIEYVFKTILFIKEKGREDYIDIAIDNLQRGLSVAEQNDDVYPKLLLNLANNYYNMGEFARKDALTYYKKLLSSNYKFKSDEQEAIIYERIGHCMFTLDDIKADDYYKKSIDLYTKIGDREAEIRLQLRRAVLYLSYKDYEGDYIGGNDAASIYKKIKVKLESEGKNDELRLLSRNLGYAYFIDLESELSKEEISTAISVLDKENIDVVTDSEYIIFSIFGLRFPIWKLNIQLGSSNPYGFTEDEELALLYAMQANNYTSTKDFDKVISYLNKKLKLFEEKENDLAVSIVLNRLGYVNYFLRNYNEADKYFSRSQKVAEKYMLGYAIIANGSNRLRCILNSDSSITNLPDIEKYFNNKLYSFEDYDIAVYYNLLGSVKYKEYETLKSGKSVKNIVESYKSLNKSSYYYSQALEYLDEKRVEQGRENKLLSAVYHNLFKVYFESGYSEISSNYLNKAVTRVKVEGDVSLLWRLYFRQAQIEPDKDKRLTLLKQSETELSRYLPEVSTFELYTGWLKDIRPLYETLVSECLNQNEVKAAFIYQERYRLRYLLDIYSTKDLHLKKQLHIAHISKIRDNNRQIIQRQALAEELKRKDKEKYKNRIDDLLKDVAFYKKELDTIFSEIKEKDDTRLLQFVSINPLESDEWGNYFKDTDGVVSYFKVSDELVIFSLIDEKVNYKSIDYKEIAILDSNSNEYSKKLFDKYIAPVYDCIMYSDNLYIIPDYTEDFSLPYQTAYNTEEEEFLGSEFQVSILPSLTSIKVIDENRNINNKNIYSLDSNDGNLEEIFESQGVVVFDKIKQQNKNPLDNIISNSGNEITLKDIMKYQMAGYAAFIPKSDNYVSDIVLLNTLFYCGIPTVIKSNDTQFIQSVFEELDDKTIGNIYNDLSNNLSYSDKWKLYEKSVCGSFGMSGKEQKSYAKKNLMEYAQKGNRYLKIKRYREALYFYNSAITMAHVLNDEKAIENLYKLIANCYSGDKDYENAIDTRKKLLEIYENSLSKKVSVYSDISKEYLRDGLNGNKVSFDSAMVWQRKVYDIVKGKSKKAELSSLNLLAIIASGQGDYKASINYQTKYLEEAKYLKSSELSDVNNNIPEKATEKLFSYLKTVMVNYYRAGELDSALYVYDVISKNSSMFKNIPQSEYFNLYESCGLCYQKKSFFGNAEDFYKKALDIAKNDSEKFSVYQNFSDLYYKWGQTRKALEYAEKAHDYASNNDFDGLMRNYNTQSLIYEKLKNYKKAISLSYQALEQALLSKDISKQATARVNLAKILLSSNQPDEANSQLNMTLSLTEKMDNLAVKTSVNYYKGIYFENLNSDSTISYLKKSLSYAKQDNDKIFESRALLKIGSLFIQLDKIDSAMVYLDNAVDISETYDFKDIYYSAFAKQADILIKQNKKVDAVFNLKKVIEKIEKDVQFNYRTRLEGESWDIIIGIYDKLLFLSALDNRCADYLEYYQRREAISVQNDLNGIKPKFEDENMKRTYTVIDSLKKDYSSLSSNYVKNILSENYFIADFILSEIDNIESKFKSVKGNVKIISQKEISKYLKTDEVILLYSTSANNSSVLYLDKEKCYLTVLNDNKKIIDNTYFLYNRITTGLDVEKVSESLYSYLIKPIEKDIVNKENLIISSNGFLRNFPFEMLLNNSEYLIDNYDIAVVNGLPSIDLSLSDRNYNKIYSFVNGFSAKVPDLEFADKEAEYLKWEYNNTAIYSGKNATETKLKEVDKSDGNNLYHFATHAFIAKKDSVQSAVRLTADSKNNGLYEFSEIVGGNFENSDIVLSACETSGAYGAEYRNYYDLSRGFKIAGASSIISSRWKVDDLIAAVTMKRYFRYLSEGRERISALSSAKRDVKKYLRQYPYYWAVFRLDGTVR